MALGSRVFAGVILALVVVSLGACGRRGDLEPPNAYATPDKPRPSAKITPPHEAFVLDPLLK